MIKLSKTKLKTFPLQAVILDFKNPRECALNIFFEVRPKQFIFIESLKLTFRN